MMLLAILGAVIAIYTNRCNWAAEVQKQFASVGVTSPLPGGRVRNVDHLDFCKAIYAGPRRVCLEGDADFADFAS